MERGYQRRGAYDSKNGQNIVIVKILRKILKFLFCSCWEALPWKLRSHWGFVLFPGIRVFLTALFYLKYPTRKKQNKTCSHEESDRDKLENSTMACPAELGPQGQRARVTGRSSRVGAFKPCAHSLFTEGPRKRGAGEMQHRYFLELDNHPLIWEVRKPCVPISQMGADFALCDPTSLPWVDTWPRTDTPPCVMGAKAGLGYALRGTFRREQGDDVGLGAEPAEQATVWVLCPAQEKAEAACVHTARRDKKTRRHLGGAGGPPHPLGQLPVLLIGFWTLALVLMEPTWNSCAWTPEHTSVT